jgi:hypothetical protein
MKFVVYEIWTRARIIEAKDQDHADTTSMPEPIVGLSLCNWHAIAVPSNAVPVQPTTPKFGALKKTE